MTEPLTLNVAIDRYLDDLQEVDPRLLRARRSHLRRVELTVDPSMPIRNLLTIYEDLVSRIREQAPRRGSHTAIISTLRHFIRWSLSTRLISTPEAVSGKLGMPRTETFAIWTEHPRALSLYKVLLVEMQLGSTRASELDETYFNGLLEILPSRLSNWRACYEAFRCQWRTLADDGLLPELELPDPPSGRRRAYAAKREDLPDHISEELGAVVRRLRGDDLCERFGRPPYDGSTVELLVGVVMRLLGHMRETQPDKYKMLRSLSEALALECAMSLVSRTNEGWLREHDDRNSDYRDTRIGTYELGQLRQLAAVVRVGLRNEELHALYLEEIHYLAQQARARREPLKELTPVDEYYRVAMDLVSQARTRGWESGPTPGTAVLIRDALLIALIATFGYRRGVLAELRVGENLRRRQGTHTIICVPKERTKPRQRDLIHELPSEIEPLLRDYIQKARPLLLASSPEHGFLFVSSSNGLPLSDGAIYAQVTTRTQEVLGVARNPHLIRKSLANDYAHWSRGDFMTAAAVLDSSPLTLQKHYARLQTEAHIESFDAATRHAWEEYSPEEGAA